MLSISTPVTGEARAANDRLLDCHICGALVCVSAV